MGFIKPTHEKPYIDLNGPQGNAFFILGTASKLAKKLGLDEQAIIKEMKAEDYDNLLIVFNKHFGDYMDLMR